MNDVEAAAHLQKSYDALRKEIAKVIVGQDKIVEQLLISLLARGHCLLVGVPGLAKTLLIRTLAEVLELSFNRIQFTPDLMPSDITGTEIIEENTASGAKAFKFIHGPVSYTHLIKFTKAAATLSAEATKTLSSVGVDLKSDPSLRVQFIAYPDTSSKRKQNEKLAQQRLNAAKNLVAKKFGIAVDRIITATRPQTKDTAAAKQAERQALVNRVDVEILNRRAVFVGAAETALQPVTTDERTMKADSLQAGSFSSPFNYRGNFTIVRLNKKDPLRRKTYQEAGTEVSSAFQEYESKRLEKEWIDGLRQRYPVVEYKEVLKNAFAPAK